MNSNDLPEITKQVNGIDRITQQVSLISPSRISTGDFPFSLVFQELKEYSGFWNVCTFYFGGVTVLARMLSKNP